MTGTVIVICILLGGGLFGAFLFWMSESDN